MESIPTIVSTVLLLILIPSVAYMFVNTPAKEDFVNHAQNDEANMREIRASISSLGGKIDAAMIAMLSANQHRVYEDRRS